MATPYQVEMAAVAASDLQSIIAFIATSDPLTAVGVLDKLEERIQTLRRMPKRGRVVPELAVFGIHTYRELVVTPWRIIYRVSDHTAYVLAVLDGRRNVEDVLLDRLL